MVDPSIVVAGLGIAGSLTLAWLNSRLGKRTERAKNEIDIAGAQVDTAIKAMDGMDRLAAARLADIQRLESRVAELEHDLIEERATNLALSRLNERLGGSHAT